MKYWLSNQDDEQVRDIPDEAVTAQGEDDDELEDDELEDEDDDAEEA